MLVPIYLRGRTYYLHTRLANGSQYKKSLRTSNKQLAIIKASDLLRKIFMIEFDKSIAITYEIDLNRGMVKADGVEDHQRHMEALTLLRQIQPPYTQSTEVKPCHPL